MHSIIVRQGDFQTYDVLYKAFSARLPIIWDRRKRQSSDSAADTDRRTGVPPVSWTALGFVVVDR
jgi:hypothetical protein